MSAPGLAATRAAGHAVARWWLDRCHCLGRRHELPPLRFLTIDETNSVPFGVCDANPCFDPAMPPDNPRWISKLAYADVVQCKCIARRFRGVVGGGTLAAHRGHNHARLAVGARHFNSGHHRGRPAPTSIPLQLR